MSGEFPRVYLLDVEGTVAPISFVYEQLFPYARAHFEEFVRTRLIEDREEISEIDGFADLFRLAHESKNEQEPAAPHIFPDSVDLHGYTGNWRTFGFVPSVAASRLLAYINWLMDRDRKSTALKSLQGKIWKAGFESGELKGALFDDVPDALARWSAVGKVAIYSSGSVEAQRLVFRHSIFGDLTSVISNYFDTRTGAKGEPASYTAIAAAMGVVADEVLFFSDAVRELDAARAAGCDTRLVVREGNAPVEDAHGHAAVESFTLI
jgi:enolase-phosphatase E1